MTLELTPQEKLILEQIASNLSDFEKKRSNLVFPYHHYIGQIVDFSQAIVLVISALWLYILQS